ncbi:MAG: hypothetical protein ACREBA_04635 [Nitrosotalea sp.]
MIRSREQAYSLPKATQRRKQVKEKSDDKLWPEEEKSCQTLQSRKAKVQDIQKRR